MTCHQHNKHKLPLQQTLSRLLIHIYRLTHVPRLTLLMIMTEDAVSIVSEVKCSWQVEPNRAAHDG